MNDKTEMLRQWRNERMKIADECEKRGDHAGAKSNRKVASLYDNLLKKANKDMVTATYFTQDLTGEVQQHELQVNGNNIFDAYNAAVKAGADPFSKMYFKVSKCGKGK